MDIGHGNLDLRRTIGHSDSGTKSYGCEFMEFIRLNQSSAGFREFLLSAVKRNQFLVHGAKLARKNAVKMSTYGERAANNAGRAALVTILLTIAIV